MKYIKAAGAFAAIFIMLSLVTIHPVAASNYTKQTYTIDWQPYSHDYDEIINRAGDERLNYNTWNPNPGGVYAGSYIPESELALNKVMKYWYSTDYFYASDNTTITSRHNTSHYGGKVILAQYVRYDASIIMSGSSMMYVRLPIRASSFEKGLFYVYHVDGMDSNIEISNNSLKNFVSGYHNVFFTTWIEHYTCGNKYYDGRYIPHIDKEQIVADVSFTVTSDTNNCFTLISLPTNSKYAVDEL